MQTITHAEEILLLLQENASFRCKVIVLKNENIQLKALLQEALDKLDKNSSNSSKPPSSDMVRTKSLRVPSGKAPGAQQGHKGNHLPMSIHVDDSIVYRAKTCADCGKDISGVGTQNFERR